MVGLRIGENTVHLVNGVMVEEPTSDIEVLSMDPNVNARNLLRSHLTEEQLLTVDESRKQYFDVVSSEGNTWRIFIQDGVYRMHPEGMRGRHYCIVMPGYPKADAALAKKLLLEKDEREFLRIAIA